IYTCHASARRSGAASWSSTFSGMATYVLVVAGMAALTPAARGGVPGALRGGAVVALLGLGTGVRRKSDAPTWARLAQPLTRRVPPVL
ncbi:hypothetical protein K3W82_14795, partial [Listeria monocytogenes]|nr:hypothetical protein [Listeria monocytogenes]